MCTKRKYLNTAIPNANIDDILKSIEELNSHLKDSSEYNENIIINNDTTSLLVNCIGADEYSEYNSIEIVHSFNGSLN